MAKSFTYSIQSLRLGEFDLGGVLYHANYFHLYEMAREAFLISGQIPYSQLVNNGQHLAIVESHQNFILPVRYGVPLEIGLSADDIKRSSFVFHYEITTSLEIVHRAWTKMVFVQNDGGSFKPRALPDNIRVLLENTSYVRPDS